MVSERFRIAVKTHLEPQYILARRAGVNPHTLSSILTGRTRVKTGDPRVVRIGKVLGLPPQLCFSKTDPDEGKLLTTIRAA